ncbi:MAG: ADP-ribosylglycohydrolase family protein [Deltaproteobacteria bacterium]|nr:ADP-ribosylglycohydrolase family protein [Deltaproteobacteria bacterium]
MKIAATILLVSFAGASPSFAAGRTLDHAALVDRISGGWVGQMAGVAWGASTEFDYLGRYIPDDEVPALEAGMIQNGFLQDDIYVEIPFIAAMREHGVACAPSAFGDHFMESEFPLWHANLAGRDNLLQGVPAPESGHYSRNPHCDDIDWQIEADFAGIVSPGLPMAAADIAWRGGHVMNFGDGVYGGVAVAVMHAVAYFAGSVGEIAAAGRDAVPQGTKYRAVIDDVFAGRQANPSDWTRTWQAIEDKWGGTDRCPDGKDAPYNIDAAVNGAYVFMGLLYGGGDFEKSMRIAMQGGQDSDCNPSTVGGILGSFIGYSGIPDKFKSDLDFGGVFFATDCTLDTLVSLSERLAREVIGMSGGTVSGAGKQKVYAIPEQGVAPPIFEQWPLVDNPAPVLDASVSGVDGLTVAFAASADDDDGIAAHQWFFGDLSFADGAAVSHTYLREGSYEVTAYVADTTGNTSWKTLTVAVSAPDGGTPDAGGPTDASVATPDGADGGAAAGSDSPAGCGCETVVL